ncbi:MAG: BNR repeat-containing protein [Planctomycetes bacterium]|nr:BNR repeat-containing protein [Planctomycetota bacterium]
MKYSKPFLLSDQGSIRGTSYCFSNKAVTLNGKTHVVWLDRPAFVRGRAYDHAKKSWGPTLELYEGSDNHTSPALIADSFADPHLRLVLGPHGAGWNGGQFKWTISENPGSLEKWKWDYSFGYTGTYPALAHTPQGFDAMAYRGGEWPPSLMFQRLLNVRQWTKAREIFRQDVGPQYCHYGAFLECDAKGTLYLASHFYTETPPINGKPTDPYHGVALIKSTDLGDTWTTLSGEVLKLPTLFDERFAVPPRGKGLALGGLAIDSNGTPWVVSVGPGDRTRNIFVSRWTDGRWETHDAGQFLPADRAPVDTTLTIDTKDRLHIAVTALLHAQVPDSPDHPFWGHASSEVFHMVSADQGKTYSCNQVSPSDDKFPSWLPNMSKNTPFHPVENPVILYTHGAPGANFVPGRATPQEPVTEVYCVFTEQDGK